MQVYFLLGILGVCGGAVIAAGLCALITSTGIVTRMADKSHTAGFIREYENAIILGAILWNVLWLFLFRFPFSGLFALIFQIIIGVFQGMFVGCLAVSLAETLNGTAIFSRRVKLYKGVGVIILFTAIGKTVFALVQFLF